MGCKKSHEDCPSPNQHHTDREKYLHESCHLLLVDKFIYINWLYITGQNVIEVTNLMVPLRQGPPLQDRPLRRAACAVPFLDLRNKLQFHFLHHTLPVIVSNWNGISMNVDPIALYVIYLGNIDNERSVDTYKLRLRE